MLWWFAVFVACLDTEIAYYAEICQDWDFGEVDESVLELSKEGDSFLFFRPGVERACSASFQPEFEAHNRMIQVFEFWEYPVEDEDCTTCFTPTTVLSGLKTRGTYELQWFEGRDSTLPIGAMELSVSGEWTQ